MRPSRPLRVTLLLLPLTLLLMNTVVRAEDNDSDDYEVKARVARISLISGEVTLTRDGNTDSERARLNSPLVEGDVLRTDREARLEIQIDARNFVRVGSSSVLRIVTLREEGIALSLVEGTLSVRLVKFDREQEYFEVDAPKITLAAEKKGLYRIDVASEGRVRLTVHDDGRARIYSETSGFVLRDGRAAELISEGANAGDWELMAAAAQDSWDTWIVEREQYLARRALYNTQYYDSYIWGAEDLYAYGNWVYTNDYGWIWQPHATVINTYNNWSPYRYGHWTWCPPYGWTWVGYEPWGWAPYHYGRWVYYNNYWAWCPRSQYYHHRSWWRPALVAFVSFHFSFGDHIYWYPLSYHQRDPYSRRYSRDRLPPLRRQELADLRRVNPAYLRAVTAVPARDFGGDTARPQPTTDQLARRVISAEPLREALPVRPSVVSGNGRREVAGPIDRARPGDVAPTAQPTFRPTGAAARNPGRSLDEQLRRTTILNGREPRTSLTVAPGGQSETRPTGAVVRPARPMREPVRHDEEQRGSPEEARPDERVSRPTRTAPQEQRPPVERAAPINRDPTVMPAQPEASPARPERRESPKRVERPDSSERGGGPANRPQPAERRNEPAPQRSEPAPRYEAPARPPTSGPPSRSESPPRSEAPHRSEPPPARSEPAPRSEPQQRPDAARPAPREDPGKPSRGERKNDP